MDYTKTEIIDYIDCLLSCCDETCSSESHKTTVLQNLKPSSYIYVLTCIKDYIERT